MTSLLILGVFGIGIIAGLRSFTAPAVICWATYFGWLDLSESRLSLLGTPVAIGIVSLLALGELVADKLPMTPNRISAGPLLARVVTAAFSAIAMAMAVRQSAIVASVAGVVGAVVGAFGGYYARRSLVRRFGLSDFAIALIEDLVAVGGAFWLVRQVG